MLYDLSTWMLFELPLFVLYNVRVVSLVFTTRECCTLPCFLSVTNSANRSVVLQEIYAIALLDTVHLGTCYM